MKKQDVEITIDSVGRRGDGVGTWQGQPVFVPRALPGEAVRVQLLEARDKGIAGRLLSVVTPHAQRVTAPCPHYDHCGGCSLQHWDPQNYQSWKIDRLPQLLERANITVGEWLPPIFIPDNTRRRATLAAVVENKKLRLGFHRARSHDIADIANCLLLTPTLQAFVTSLRPYLLTLLTPNKPADIFVQDTGATREVMITGPVGNAREPNLLARETMAAMAQNCNIARLSWRARERDAAEIIAQQSPVTKICGPLTVALPPGAFMQPSAEGEAALITAALAPVRAAAAKKTADLFAGCGTFSGPLLSLGATVLAAESEAGAMTALQKAAAGTALTTATRNLYSNPLTAKELTGFDAVLFDPPRMGAKEQAVQLASSTVPLVVAISCNPATFIRDAEILQSGGYRLDTMQVIDQFIWSSHLELVGVFRRQGTKA